jgi:hypothetical protein
MPPRPVKAPKKKGKTGKGRKPNIVEEEGASENQDEDADLLNINDNNQIGGID